MQRQCLIQSQPQNQDLNHKLCGKQIMDITEEKELQHTTGQRNTYNLSHTPQNTLPQQPLFNKPSAFSFIAPPSNTPVAPVIPTPPNTIFRFAGKPLSLASRLVAMKDEDLQKITDAHITITGQQIQPVNKAAYMATMLGASLILVPLFFTCCDWWKRCTLQAHTVPMSVYQSLSILTKGGNLKTLALIVKDNTFDAAKANLIYTLLAESGVRYFFFNNSAGEYDFYANQHTQFVRNMRPIKQELGHIGTTIRWGDQIAQ